MRATLAALKPDMARARRVEPSLDVTGITVFAPSGESPSAIHVRSFAPAHGIPEDPVCGSGNICGRRATCGISSVAPSAYVARQGMQMGRDGRVHGARRARRASSSAAARSPASRARSAT